MNKLISQSIDDIVDQWKFDDEAYMLLIQGQFMTIKNRFISL